MNKLRLSLLLFYSVFTLLTIQAQTTNISLNSSNTDINWELKPKEEVNNSGNEISISGFKMKDYIKAVVPGVVFTSYVEAGIEKDPNFADNIQQVDETFCSRPFWYRTEFQLPKTYKKG